MRTLSLSALPSESTLPAYRLPDALSLGPVRLRVLNLKRSLDFYRDVIGLHARVAAPGIAQLSAGPDGPPLLVLHEDPGAHPVPPRGRIGLYHVALLLPDRTYLGQSLYRLLKHDWPLDGAADHLVSEALYLRDPDGIGLELYADRPRGDWTWDQTEVRMATAPLDLNALVRAGHDAHDDNIDAPMPAGACVGHVHLHVDDLAAAERFYHDGLGFDVTARSYPGALFMSAGGYHHHLAVNTWAGPGASPTGPDATGLIDWELQLPEADLRALLARLAEVGVLVEPDGGAWRIEDPAAIPLRLRERPDPGDGL